jgi:hypothetical protein
MDGGTFLTQHLIALKDANRGVQMNWSFNEYIGGAQLTCTIIANYLATLGDISKKHLFLQLDNCSGENKNWLLLQFTSLLVDKKIVKSIEINFLPVGHTHIDIDQVRRHYTDFILTNGRKIFFYCNDRL